MYVLVSDLAVGLSSRDLTVASLFWIVTLLWLVNSQQRFYCDLSILDSDLTVAFPFWTLSVLDSDRTVASLLYNYLSLAFLFGP